MAEPPLGLAFDTETGDPVLRPALGLTAYLSEPVRWAREGVSGAFRAFLELVPGDRLAWATSSLLRDWRPVTPGSLESADAALSSWTLLTDQPRHFFWVRFADVPNVPALGFSYTEVDPRRVDRTPVIELTLPPDAPPEHLLRLARALLDLGPLESLVGGHVVRWNTLYQRLAFNQAFLWARRYLGLDLHDSDEFAWHAPRELTSPGWLTYVGAGVLRAHEQDPEALATGWGPGIVATPIGGGVLLQADKTPSLGDRNQLQFPVEMAEVTRRLEALMVAEPPPFWGEFMVGDRTRRWYRRLIAPEEWEEA